jgi:hypothetical protein
VRDRDTPVVRDRQYGRYTYIPGTATGKPGPEGMPNGRALGLARARRDSEERIWYEHKAAPKRRPQLGSILCKMAIGQIEKTTSRQSKSNSQARRQE